MSSYGGTERGRTVPGGARESRPTFEASGTTDQPEPNHNEQLSGPQDRDEIYRSERPGVSTPLLAQRPHSQGRDLKDISHALFTRQVAYAGGKNGRTDNATASDTHDTGPALRGHIYGTLTPESGTPKGRSMSTTELLALKHDVNYSRTMYISYYFPILQWVQQYQLSWFLKDFVGAITVATIYIPMSFSFGLLAHINPINGLYSFVVSPLVYAMLGTCPQMVVGPEAPGSLLVGTLIQTSTGVGDGDDSTAGEDIAGAATAIAGLVLLFAGLLRIGFLDNLLNRPFMRGFIAAVGFVLLVDQAVPELGLNDLARQDEGVSNGSTAAKLVFLVGNIKNIHGLTAAVSITSFVAILVAYYLKRKLGFRYSWIVYIPDRFVVLFIAALLTWGLKWDQKGLEILGQVGYSSSFTMHLPSWPANLPPFGTILSTATIIALLGFFESSVSSKSLGQGQLNDIMLSTNRELVALGAANVAGGCFMALPAFGGYGRSKINAAAGAITPMSSIILSVLSLLCTLYGLPYFYYLPKGVLSAMLSLVAYSMLEECPHEINFFLRLRAWRELGLIALIFFATIFYSLSLGIALGLGVSVLALIRHATTPRIELLGRRVNTNTFEATDVSSDTVEHVPGCLIVRIPAPLNFANTGDLIVRLRRLELHGSVGAHPSLPRLRPDNDNVIFDVGGVTAIDACGIQTLADIVENYIDRGVKVVFCNFPAHAEQVVDSFWRSGIVDLCGGSQCLAASVEDAMRLIEADNTTNV